ncbi:hypothetical protein [Phenylobacterium sp. J367]|uniref:hypothetical protein n=1 Tax=Phenylobacterium sp. J367 TaxID=2898435 RepID=UPI0021509D6D|nr:hypothetical protein [Phenylobacterium sp. J367]MCR5877743.1 hypothetical protein [Phenylobacterium sp. J367]
MDLRRLVKPVAFVGVFVLYVAAFLLLALLFLTDQRLPYRAVFGVWPLLMLVGLIALPWRHRERAAWLLALVIGLAPFLAVGLLVVEARLRSTPVRTEAEALARGQAALGATLIAGRPLRATREQSGPWRVEVITSDDTDLAAVIDPDTG